MPYAVVPALVVVVPLLDILLFHLTVATLAPSFVPTVDDAVRNISPTVAVWRLFVTLSTEVSTMSRSLLFTPDTLTDLPVSAAWVLLVEMVPIEYVVSSVPTPPPPPDDVPVACVPSALKKIFPDVTSDSTAVVGDVSVNRAVELPDGTVMAGTAE